MGKNDVDRVGTPLQRLWRLTFVNEATGCFEWGGATNSVGYGTIHVRGRTAGSATSISSESAVRNRAAGVR